MPRWQPTRSMGVMHVYGVVVSSHSRLLDIELGQPTNENMKKMYFIEYKTISKLGFVTVAPSNDRPYDLHTNSVFHSC